MTWAGVPACNWEPVPDAVSWALRAARRPRPLTPPSHAVWANGLGPRGRGPGGGLPAGLPGRCLEGGGRAEGSERGRNNSPPRPPC